MASSPASSSQQKKTQYNSCPSVFVSNHLLKLIDPHHAEVEQETKKLTTMEEMLHCVKNYIVKNKLYNPTNPLKILLHQTPFGTLLEKDELTLHDLRDILIEKFVFPAEANSSEVCSIKQSEKICEPRKRKLDFVFDAEFSAKKIKGSGYDSSDESIKSMQNYETDFVEDDDNFSNVIFAETFDVDVEYEIDDDTDGDFSCESDSDIEDIVKNAVIHFIAGSSDSDLEYLADSSSGDESQSEEEISEKDQWTCLSCFNLNHPRMGQCEACLVTRRGFYSDKKKEKCDIRQRNKREHSQNTKRKFPKRKKINKKNSSIYKLSDLPKESVAKENLSKDDSTAPSNSLEADKEHLSKDEKICLFCCSKPADSSIIHGKVGCKVCCYACGNRLLNTQKRCPVCRRMIERICYLYNA